MYSGTVLTLLLICWYFSIHSQGDLRGCRGQRDHVSDLWRLRALAPQRCVHYDQGKLYTEVLCVIVFLYIFCTITKMNFVQRYCMYFIKMLGRPGEVPLRQRNHRLLRGVHVSLGGFLLGRLETLLSRDLSSVGCLWLRSWGALTKGNGFDFVIFSGRASKAKISG